MTLSLKDNYKNMCWKQYDKKFNNKKAWPKENFPEVSSEYFKDIGCFIFSIANGLRLYNVVDKNFDPWIFHKKISEANLYSPAGIFIIG